MCLGIEGVFLAVCYIFLMQWAPNFWTRKHIFCFAMKQWPALTSTINICSLFQAPEHKSLLNARCLYFLSL